MLSPPEFKHGQGWVADIDPVFLISTTPGPVSVEVTEIVDVYVQAHLAGNYFSAGVHFLAPTIGLIEPLSSTVKVQHTCTLAPVTIFMELNHVVEFFPVGVSTIQSCNGIVHMQSIKDGRL
jgi:hypothetical protein